ncbi:MAG: hypothetical protein H7Y88_02860 [Phycisphaerales bacterium]|nr:hypothetical protein [Phycisphaerales bacterium]
MPCLLGLLAFFFPRFVIVLLVVFSDYIGDAYRDTMAPFLIPFLGFFFAPFTTLAYALANHQGGVDGLYLVILIVAILFDLGIIGGGGAKARRGYTRVTKVGKGAGAMGGTARPRGRKRVRNEAE